MKPQSHIIHRRPLNIRGDSHNPKQSHQWFCPNCGYECNVKGNRLRCPQCGSPLASK